jgi:hypothetical protein
MMLGQDCYIVRDHHGQALAHLYFEDEPGRRSMAHLLTRDEARRIAVNIARCAFSWLNPQGRTRDRSGMRERRP